MRGSKARRIRKKMFEQGISIAAEPYSFKLRKVKTLGLGEIEVQSRTVLSSLGRRAYQWEKKRG